MNLLSYARAAAAPIVAASALTVPLPAGTVGGAGMPAGFERLLGAAPLAAQLPAPAVSSRRPFHVGGYGSVVGGRADFAAGPASNDIVQAAAALLVSGSFGRASYFGEFEPASRTRETWSGRFEDEASDLERLYAEYAFADALRLRVGRFLTPVGQWNELHAEPLTWTALRPLTTFRPFSKSSTGVMAAGTIALGPRDAGYALWVAPVRVGAARGEETAFTSAGGGRVAVEVLPQVFLGVSALRFRASRPVTPLEDSSDSETRDSTDTGEGPGSGGTDREEDVHARSLLGADASWTFGRLELLAEAIYTAPQGENRAERGAFLQAAIPLLPWTHLVLRAERYGPVGANAGDLGIYTAGATIRPNPHVTLKLDRQLTSRVSARVPDGWFVSASAIF
jgi:hypothetical protein